MKTVIFHGEPTSLGRFGVAEEGAHLQLTEAEFITVKGDSRFESITRRRPPRDIHPLGTPAYDLRLVLWDHARLESVLSKKGKTTLKLIAEAMALVGADVSVTIHDNTPVIVDAIVAEAKALGWTSLDREARLALGVLETTTGEEMPVDEAPEIELPEPETDPADETEAEDQPESQPEVPAETKPAAKTRRKA